MIRSKITSAPMPSQARAKPRSPAMAAGASRWSRHSRLVGEDSARRVVEAARRAICRSCDGVATEVHHLPSATYGDEKIEDLISVCRDCNQAERTARITKRVLG